MERYPFYTALTHLRDTRAIDMNPDEFESLAFHAWKHIGNKEIKIYRHYALVENDKVVLPCNVEIIESVHAMIEDFYKPENVSREDYSALTIETYIEGRKIYQHPVYQTGRLLDYELVDGTLYVRGSNNSNIVIVYKGIFCDDEGLPFINYKEMQAIANYCAYVSMMKKGMSTFNSAIIQAAQLLKVDWEKSCDDARTPIYMNQNDFDQILDVKSSWDRKRFGKSFKPIR